MSRINWNEKYQLLAPVLKGICRRYVKDIGVAEDIVHNTFEVAIQKVGDFKGNGSFEGWIKRIAINQCIQFLRDRKKIVENLEEYKHCLSVDMKGRNSFEDKRQMAFNCDELLEVIDQLPEHHKLVFNLYVLDGFKHQEIADKLNITIGTSKSHLSRARKKAQTLLLDKTKEERFAETHHRAWILLLFLRFDLIDLIFKKGLANFSISSGITPATIASSPGITIPWVVPLVCKVVLYVSLFSSVTGVAFVVLNKNNDDVHKISVGVKTLVPVQDSITERYTDTLVAKEEKIVSEFNDSIKETHKVVIRKKIIVRDTVYVQKPR